MVIPASFLTKSADFSNTVLQEGRAVIMEGVQLYGQAARVLPPGSLQPGAVATPVHPFSLATPLVCLFCLINNLTLFPSVLPQF